MKKLALLFAHRLPLFLDTAAWPWHGPWEGQVLFLFSKCACESKGCEGSSLHSSRTKPRPKQLQRYVGVMLEGEHHGGVVWGWDGSD